MTASRSSAGTATPPVDETDSVSIIHEVIECLRLDLTGLTVLTEAATGAFAATAAIAASAGASRVIAIARDSIYGAAAEAERQTIGLAQASGRSESLTVIDQADDAAVSSSDVVTNLGFVRPINARMIERMKPTAVVALMCETWEWRSTDVDADACRARGILVLGTNEHDPSLPVFAHCGPLALRLLADAGVDHRTARLVILGSDQFAPVIVDALRQSGATVRHDEALSPVAVCRAISGADAILVADYGDTIILGDGGLLSAGEVAQLAPRATIVQFAGGLNGDSLVRQGLRVWPWPPVAPRRMSRTLAHLGARPVIELHAAGLKVAECGARERLAGRAPADAARAAMQCSPLVQRFIL